MHDFPSDDSLLYHYRGSGNGSGASDVGEVTGKSDFSGEFSFLYLKLNLKSKKGGI
jgi:hypothetical protein